MNGEDLETICESGSTSDQTHPPCIPHGGIDWGDKDRILYSPFNSRGHILSVPVPATGDEPRELLSADSEDGDPGVYQDILTPHFLPEEKGILFARVHGNSDLRFAEVQTHLLTSGSEKSQPLIEQAVDARYVDPGYIVFARNGDLWAIRFDLETLQTRGVPKLVLEGVFQFWGTGPGAGETGNSSFAISRNGTLAYIDGEARPESLSNTEFFWINRTGEAVRHNLTRGSNLRFLDSGQIVVSDFYNRELFRWDEERRLLQNLRVDGVLGFAPGPGPEEITYSKFGEDTAIYKRKIDAEPGAEEKLIDPGFPTFIYEWTPDGKILLFGGLNRAAGEIALQSI